MLKIFYPICLRWVGKQPWAGKGFKNDTFFKVFGKCPHCQPVLSFYKVLETVSRDDVNTHHFFFQIKIKMSHYSKPVRWVSVSDFCIRELFHIISTFKESEPKLAITVVVCFSFSSLILKVSRALVFSALYLFCPFSCFPTSHLCSPALMFK